MGVAMLGEAAAAELHRLNGLVRCARGETYFARGEDARYQVTSSENAQHEMPEPPPYPTARGGHPGFPGGITAFGAALYLPHDLLVANPFTCAPTLPDRLWERYMGIWSGVLALASEEHQGGEGEDGAWTAALMWESVLAAALLRKPVRGHWEVAVGKRLAQCEQGRWDEVALGLLRDYNRWSGNQIRKASKSGGITWRGLQGQ